MSTCQGMEERLNDYADGALTATERHEVDRHLTNCRDCRSTLDALCSLRRAAAALPRSLEPSRDLWPEIEASLPEPGNVPRLSPAPHPAAVRPWWTGLAAAAVLLVAVTAGITGLLMRRGPVAPDPGDRGVHLPGGATLAAFRAAEDEYVRATDDLQRLLNDRRDELPPETVALVEENLRIIDGAIREVWAALENEPNAPRNGLLFTSLYRKKITLLQRAVSLPEQS